MRYILPVFLLSIFLAKAQPLPPVISGGTGSGGGPTNGLTASQVAAQISASNLITASLAASQISTNLPILWTVGKSNALFGPFTPGTSTEGLQEAIDALPHKFLTNNLAVGGKITVGPGNYYFTNTIILTNLYLTSTTIEGAGKISSIWHYRGTNYAVFANNNTTMGRLFLYVRDLGFVMDNNVTNAFWNIKQWADVGFERCYFTYDGYATNAVWGISPASTIPDPVNYPKLCGGIDITGADELRTWFKDCNFNGLAYGIYASAAHLSVDYCTFVQIGNHANGNTNGWPITNSKATGCGVIMDNMNYQATINRSDFVSGRATFALFNSVGGIFDANDCYFEAMGAIYNDDTGATLKLKNCSAMVGTKLTSANYTAAGTTSTKTINDGFDAAAIDSTVNPTWKVNFNGTDQLKLNPDTTWTFKSNVVISTGASLNGNGLGLTNVGGIKVYRALISQAGASAPTAVVIENTLPGTMTWRRAGAGSYTVSNSTPIFSPLKTYYSSVMLGADSIEPYPFVWAQWANSNVINILGHGDDEMSASAPTPFEIRVSP